MLSKDTRRLKTQIPTHTTVAKKPGIGDDRPQMQRNTLQLNRGDGTFAEVARFAGVSGSGSAACRALPDAAFPPRSSSRAAAGA